MVTEYADYQLDDESSRVDRTGRLPVDRVGRFVPRCNQYHGNIG